MRDFASLQKRFALIGREVAEALAAAAAGEPVEELLDQIAADCDALGDQAHEAADAVRAAKGDPPGAQRRIRVRQAQSAAEPMSAHEMRRLDGLKLGPTG